MQENSPNVIKDLYKAFRHRKRPKVISSHKNFKSDDHECNSIQMQFGDLELANMTDYDAIMMMIDSALISEDAILYFLPKLAHVALNGGRHSEMLLGQIRQLNKSNLNKNESDLVGVLEQNLMAIIKDDESDLA
jgi:hypothetical protein